MVIGRNEVNDSLVIGLGNKLVRAFTKIWNEETKSYSRKGYWSPISHHDPVMVIQDISKLFNTVEMDMLKFKISLKI